MKLSKMYIGKPCRHGHGAWRYVSNGRCIFCISLSGRKNYQARKEREERVEQLYWGA